MVVETIAVEVIVDANQSTNETDERNNGLIQKLYPMYPTAEVSLVAPSTKPIETGEDRTHALKVCLISGLISSLGILLYIAFVRRKAVRDRTP